MNKFAIFLPMQPTNQTTAEKLNVKFIEWWPLMRGDLYIDNVTGSSFVVRPGEQIETIIAEVRAEFEIAGEREGE